MLLAEVPEMATRSPTEAATTDQLVPLKFWMPAAADDPDVGGRDRVDGLRGLLAGGESRESLQVVPLNCKT